MRDVLRSTARAGLRVLALAWLLVIAPLELAASLVSLLSRPVESLGAAAAVLVAARVLVIAAGLVLGRRLAQRASGLRGFAVRWAAADLGTLAVALATAAVPSSRAPGDAPIVWMGYALAAIVVVAAAD